MVPVANVAAIIKFSVPVTVTVSNIILAAFNLPRLHVALIYPSSILIDAPIASNPLICRSTGLGPIAQPPGKDTLASPNLVIKGPKIKIEARIVFTNSYGAQ